MWWLEVRRHSLTRKGTARGHGSHLSAEGVALARKVGESMGPFAYVVTSVSPRAIETAIAMGFAVDDTIELPSGYVPGEVDHHDQWRWPRPYRTYAELIARPSGLAAVAEATGSRGPTSWKLYPTPPPAWLLATAAGSSRGWWPACRTLPTSRGASHSATAMVLDSDSIRAGSSASSSSGRG
jgi:hypothetical protein